MSDVNLGVDKTVQVTNSVMPLVDYYDGLRVAGGMIREERGDQGINSLVPFDLPEKSERYKGLLDADVSLAFLGEYKDCSIRLLNLMRDPATRTTKTFPSLLMVARALEHIRLTGESVMIVTPTSGNKGTALRAAVAKAYRLGLTTPEKLRVAIVVPEESRDKLRISEIDNEPSLHAANPVGVMRTRPPSGVKGACATVVGELEDDIRKQTGFTIWYSLDLDNYRMADACRAFVEADLFPIDCTSRPRAHAHAVSSAYGLLGYELGHRVLRDGSYQRFPAAAFHPGYFLVQHLSTSSMVDSLMREAGNQSGNLCTNGA